MHAARRPRATRFVDPVRFERIQFVEAVDGYESEEAKLVSSTCQWCLEVIFLLKG